MPASDGVAWQWQVTSLAQLPGVRAALRARLSSERGRGSLESLSDRVVLAADELTSNGLRHGVPPVTLRVAATRTGWLIDVTDLAVAHGPQPAVDRDRARGGMGLHLVTELSTDRGWAVSGDHKHVWAYVPDA